MSELQSVGIFEKDFVPKTHEDFNLATKVITDRFGGGIVLNKLRETNLFNDEQLYKIALENALETAEKFNGQITVKFNPKTGEMIGDLESRLRYRDIQLLKPPERPVSQTPEASRPEKPVKSDFQAIRCEGCGEGEFDFDATAPVGAIFSQMVVLPKENTVVVQGFDTGDINRNPARLRCKNCSTIHMVNRLGFFEALRAHYERLGYDIIIQAKK
jgi:hypothetical protein